MGTVFKFGEVLSFTDFLSRFSFRLRGRVRVKVQVGGGFKVRLGLGLALGLGEGWVLYISTRIYLN